MKAFDATSKIQANPEKIWSVLTDGAHYPEWDSGVLRVEGKIAPGEKIKVVSEVNPDRTFPVKVSEFLPGQRMVWSGGMPLGLFKGVRTFTLTTASDGGTEFHMREEYSGPLASMFTRSIPDLSPSFVRFATGLKRRAESASM